MQVATQLRDDMNDGVRAQFNSGLLRGYSGSVPANANASLASAVLLFEATLNATAFPASSGGVLTANSIAGDAGADAGGTLSFARIYKSDGTTVLVQLTVGVGSGDLQVLTTLITATQPINVTNLALTFPVGP